MTHHVRTTCRLCDAPLPADRVLDLGSVPLANEYWSDHPELEQDAFPLYVSRCSACGHFQLPVVVDQRRLFPEDYVYTSGNAGNFGEHLKELAYVIALGSGSGEKFRIGRERPVIDVGSNDGTLVRYLQEYGVRALGIDPALRLAHAATQAGKVTIPAFLTVEVASAVKRAMGYESAVVTCCNAFAHVDDMHQMAEAVRVLCGDDGRVIIEVADVSEVIRKGDVTTLYAEHLSEFYLRPLVSFLARHDLTVTAAQKLPVQGGSIRVYASPRGTPIDEDTIAAFDPPPVSEWQRRADRQAAELREQIQAFLPRDDGGAEVGESIPTPRLAVFGAPARLTALAYSLKLKRGDVQCVFDDEPRKVGRFTPGLHWPIVSSSELMARNPPAILVASWNYFDFIRSRFPDYRGEWIVPNRGGA